MAKKRNCRRTKLERDQHDTAVKIRKMTDEQICVLMMENSNSGRVREFLDFVEVGIGNGIGVRTIEKLRRIAEENNFD